MHREAPDLVLRIEREVKGAGVEIPVVLAQARVAPTTWWRWKRNVSLPRTTTLMRIEAALKQLAR
jgi:hypothetical protein